MPEAETLKTGEILDLSIQGMGSRGEGLARHHDSEIFIPKTARGDQVKARILEKKKGRYRAHPIEVIKSGPLRVAPQCPHFSSCGGCDFQHLPYREQFDWKVRITKHWVRRSPLAPQLEKIPFDFIESPEPFGYRHRVRLQVKNGGVHFFLPHSNELLPIDECPVLVPGFLKALKEKAKLMPDTKDWNQSFINGKLLDGPSHYTLDGEPILFDETCFTQANFPVNERLWSRINEDIASLGQKKMALDLYCGVGNFSFPMAKHFESIIAIESHGPGIELARKNSDERGVKNIRWIAGLVEKELGTLDLSHVDYVLLDPTRTGARPACKVLVEQLPIKITYVSCHLENLVQDLVFLTKKAPYKISRWTVADMFPQTHHIESVVTLELAG